MKAQVMWDLPEDAYHADPCDVPSLSASLAHLMVSASALHAWTASRRLNPEYVSVDTDAFRLGRALHSMVLDDTPRHVVREEYNADWTSWRKRHASEWRDLLASKGLIPITADEMDRLRPMREAVHRHYTDVMGGKLETLPSEVTLIWEAGEVTNRCRVDAIDVDRRIAIDVKTTAGLADPQRWVAVSMDHGVDLRAAHYLDGLEACYSRPDGASGWRYLFLVVEKSPPYACSLVELDPRSEAMGHSKLDIARAAWSTCLKHDRWEAWPGGVTQAAAPEWRFSQWINELSGKWGAEVPAILEGDGEMET